MKAGRDPNGDFWPGGFAVVIRSKFLIPLFLLLALAACGRGSDDQVKDFFNDIAHGDKQNAAARFSPDLHEKFSQTTLHGALDHWSGEMSSHGGLSGVDLAGGVVTYNELAYYDVTLRFADGKSRSLKTTVKRQNGNWYIASAL